MSKNNCCIVACSGEALNAIALYDHENDIVTPAMVCDSHYDELLSGYYKRENKELLAIPT
jgi:hypothetical protein